ncbi:MAG: sigma-70 family RNA polymerase sigma factor [Bacteroidia bacterium]|nr:sigma-70 family RNA polymerase sigma factor [Bacteroidia bacterium]
MIWNNGFERKRFEEEQERLAEEYRKHGMSEAQIREMYLFDLAWYKSKRRYYTHTQSFTSGAFDGGNEEDFKSTLVKVFSEALSAAMDQPSNHSRYCWVEDIEDPVLMQKLKRLNENDLELLTLFAFDGYTLTEIGKIYCCTPQNIQQKYKRIKNNLL